MGIMNGDIIKQMRNRIRVKIDIYRLYTLRNSQLYIYNTSSGIIQGHSAIRQLAYLWKHMLWKHILWNTCYGS